MKLSFTIASRYIFSKKTHNIINFISSISAIGIVVVTLAIVCVLSVFNGFSKMIESSFGSFDPDLRISKKEGKVFSLDPNSLKQIENLSYVNTITESLEENALLKYSDRQKTILFKGVSPEFEKTIDLNKVIIDGEFNLGTKDVPYSIVGGGVAYELGIRPGFASPLEIFTPKRNVAVNMMNPMASYNTSKIFISSVFSLNQADYDEQMVIIPINIARKLLNYSNNEVSSLEISLMPNTSIKIAIGQISKILGDKYIIQDRLEQHQDLYRMINIEKWITFFILFVIVCIAIFNIVGSLSMLILEKKDNLKTLKNLGASNKLIYQIFFLEGILLVVIGLIAGLILGVAACLMQEKFGFIKMTGNSSLMVFDAYPVIVQWKDIFIIFASIFIIGVFAVLIPLKNLATKLNKGKLINW